MGNNKTACVHNILRGNHRGHGVTPTNGVHTGVALQGLSPFWVNRGLWGNLCGVKGEINTGETTSLLEGPLLYRRGDFQEFKFRP